MDGSRGIDGEEDEDEEAVELAVAEEQTQQFITRRSPPLPTTAASLVQRWCGALVSWRWLPLCLCLLHGFIVLAPYLSLVIINQYYFHVFALSGSPSSLVFSIIHSDLHTAAVQGEGGIDVGLRSLVPNTASALHERMCGLQEAEPYSKGICYSIAVNVSGTLLYADCAALIAVDVLQQVTDIHDAPPAEVNLYGNPCRPLPQGHPDMRVFNPYTVRCDLPTWVLARNADHARTPTPQPPPPPSPASLSRPASGSGTVSPPLKPLPPAEQIPRLIHQTHARASFLSPMQFWSMRSWIDRNPDYRYQFYDDEDVRSFIAAFSHPLLSSAQVEDVRLAAAQLRLHMPMAATADLLRYMLVLQRGGVYADMDTACIDPLSSWIDYEQDAFIIQSNMDLQWIIISAPAHPVILDSLLSAVHNVLHPLEAELALSPVYETTGPPVLLAAIARYNSAVRADPTLRPIRVVPSDPEPSEYAASALTLHGRTFNYFQFSNHLMLKSCEVEYEQRLHEHVPWVYQHRANIAAYFHARIHTWTGLTWLLCVASAALWCAAYRLKRVSVPVFVCWSVGLALLQAAMLVEELPV